MAKGMSSDLSRAAAQALNSPAMNGISFEERRAFVDAVSKCSTIEQLPLKVRQQLEDALTTAKKPS